MRWIFAIALIVAGWEAFGGIGIGLLGVGWLVYLLACAVGEFISWASGNR